MTDSLPDRPLPPGVQEEVLTRRLALYVVGAVKTRRPDRESARKSYGYVPENDGLDVREAVEWLRPAVTLHDVETDRLNGRQRRQYRRRTGRFEEITGLSWDEAYAEAESELDDWSAVIRWLYPLSD